MVLPNNRKKRLGVSSAKPRIGKVRGHIPFTIKNSKALTRVTAYEYKIAEKILNTPNPFATFRGLFPEKLPEELKNIISRLYLEPFLSDSRKTIMQINDRLSKLKAELNYLIKKGGSKEEIERKKLQLFLNEEMRDGMVHQVALELHTIFGQIPKKFHPKI